MQRVEWRKIAQFIGWLWIGLNGVLVYVTLLEELTDYDEGLNMGLRGLLGVGIVVVPAVVLVVWGRQAKSRAK